MGLKDLKGKKFGKLTVVSLNRRDKRKTYWNCVCECGNKCVVRSDLVQKEQI